MTPIQDYHLIVEDKHYIYLIDSTIPPSVIQLISNDSSKNNLKDMVYHFIDNTKRLLKKSGFGQYRDLKSGNNGCFLAWH